MDLERADKPFGIRGMDAGGGPAQELAATIRVESARWSEVVRKQRITVE